VPNPIKVVVADESPTVRLLLASMLRDDARFEVLADVATGAETLEHRDEADLVVLDLVLQDTDAFSVIGELRVAAPELPVVIVASVDPPYLRAEAMNRGAAGFFTHATEPAELLDGLVQATLRKKV
jgi:DNA-binding NarL/FixJ family response regulator